MCPKVNLIWKHCYRWVQLVMVLPRNVEDHMWQHGASIKDEVEQERQYVLWLCHYMVCMEEKE
ncbi:hypothetical protein glysoja_033578 [Glycine soja]|uniref:Uncharacterized protein n=1 Tax=Glycine soja TaxID=3848 RepID=A0A0B2P917_GLYSO|nr:hypothetical protein glysoja_033578 [Glycine soja]